MHLKTALHQTPEKAREVEQVEYLAKIIMVWDLGFDF
jgi:hypothetical protein